MDVLRGEHEEVTVVLEDPDELTLGADVAHIKFGPDSMIAQELDDLARMAEGGELVEPHPIAGDEAKVFLKAIENLAGDAKSAQQLSAQTALGSVEAHNHDQMAA